MWETESPADMRCITEAAGLPSRSSDTPASIERFGFVSPVPIDESGQIIVGQGRVAAAKLLGWTEVPALEIEHLSDTEKRAYILPDNRLAEDAGWDKEMLTIELLGLIDLDFTIELEMRQLESLLHHYFPEDHPLEGPPRN